MNLNLNVDSFVNKLRNTVSQVAYQVNSSVNTIIPGNPVYREYEILKLRCTHGPPGFIWQVYDAVKRDSASIKASFKDAIGKSSAITIASSQSTSSLSEITNLSDNKQLYTIFVFDKGQLDSLNKHEREPALEHIKKGVTQLTRLRHPSILTVQHPLEESRSSLAFVTEHVYGHLASVIELDKKKKSETVSNKSVDLVDLSSNLGPKDSDINNDNCQLDDIQVKAGLLQVCDGLRFLHSSAHLVHRNICLENIFVDSYNTWKIAGFDFCRQAILSSSVSKGHQTHQPTSLGTNNTNFDDLIEMCSDNNGNATVVEMYESLQATYKNTALSTSIVPNWSCSAPEHTNCDTVTNVADVYSLGVVACGLLSLFTSQNSYRDIDLSYEFGLLSDTYKRGIRIREIVDSLPIHIKNQLIKFTSINSESRPSLKDFELLAIFQDNQVQAIRDLDSQIAWDRLKKIDFCNRLRDILPKLSRQVKVNRVAKLLFNEMINTDMLPHVLPNIIIIAKDSTPTEFRKKIFNNLKPAFRVLQPTVVPLMLLDNLLILFDRAQHCKVEMQDVAFTLIQYLLELDQSEQVQEKCFDVLPVIKECIDDKSMRTIVLPKLGQICIKSSNYSLRLKSLTCICKLVDVIEMWTFNDTLMPILIGIRSLNADIIMSITSIIKTAFENTKSEPSKEIIACKILPFIIPLSIEKDLKLHQFQLIMALIKRLLEKIEKEQRKQATR